MPQNVTMQRPHTRIDPGDAEHNVAVTTDGDGVAAHGVVEAPRGFYVVLAKDAATPADDLELLATRGESVRHALLSRGEALTANEKDASSWRPS